MSNVKDVSMALSLDFSIFKAGLTAMYVKEAEKGFRFLALPTRGKGPEVGIGELIADIEKLAGKGSGQEIKKLVEEQVESANAENASAKGQKFDINNITFSLQMLYLYIDGTHGEGNNIIEYAINLNFNTTGLIPDALKDFVTIDHLGIAVWNTAREEILSQMSIVDMKDYLKIEEK